MEAVHRFGISAQDLKGLCRTTEEESKVQPAGILKDLVKMRPMFWFKFQRTVLS